MRRALSIVSFCIVSLCLPALAVAQATGTITGQVTDESGSVLPGATVEVINDGTGQARTVVTGSDGAYTVPLVQPGKYSVKATLQGFRTTLREGVTVSVNSTAHVDLQMQVGQIEESVTVQAEAPLVETANATMGIVIDERKVVDLPLNGRNFTQLGTLIPGVVAPPGALGGQTGDATPGGFGNATGGFNVNGQRNQSNNFLMDGATNNDTFNTGFVLRPPPDAIQEFKILTHGYTAEYGRNAGSVVNVVTKSGTNRWNGSAWEFNRDDALQARNFFAPSDQPKPLLKQNQFGAALGGPLVKNALFAFGYYEGYRYEQGITQTLTVPTPAQRSGVFTTAIRDPLTGQPFPNNTIPLERQDPTALKLMNDFIPLGNVSPNRYTVSPTVTDDRDQFGLRGDWRIGDNQTILGRYMMAKTERLTPRTTNPADSIAKATLQDVMGSHTWILSANKINVARASFNRIYANPAVTSGLQNSAYGINLANTNPLAVGLAQMAISGFVTLGDANQPFVERVNNVVQVADDFTWVKGRHSLKFGFDMRSEYMKIAFINRPNGDMTFNGAISGNAFADFLLGRQAQTRATTTQAIQDGRGWAYAAYVQDEWRVSDRITVNLGLRYELTQPFEDENDAITGIDMTRQSTVFPAAPKGLIYPGDPGVPDGIIPTDTNNVAPRLSLVWDPRGDGRTSVRTGFGVFYDALAGQGDFFQSGVLSPPFTPLVELNTPAPITLQNPLGPGTPSANPFPNNLTIIGWGTGFQTPYAYHYNLGVQHQVTSRIGAEVAYVGSRNYHMPIFMEINPGLYTPGQTVGGARLYSPAYALLRPTFSEARSWYDSLQTSVRMLPTRGINFMAAYTWSHAIDHVSGLNIANAEQPRPVLPVVQGDQASIDAALAQEKGDALFDVRHRFVLSFGYELPRLESKGALTRAVLGGWQLNGIYQTQTGFPFTVVDSVVTIQYLTNRANVTCDPNDGPKTTLQYFNTSCFQRRPVAATGPQSPSNQGRNTVRGPGFHRTDLSLFKNFDFAGHHRIQVRLEGFNVWNQARFAQPISNPAASNFGQIISAEDGRIIQLGIKYSF
jgi:outer membrane receptor protein involved in Fe transport